MTDAEKEEIVQEFRGEPLPDYGKIYFDELLAEYRTIPKETSAVENSGMQAVVGSILGKKNLTWGDVYAFEKAIIKLQSLDTLRRRAWSLRSKYKDVAGQTEYDTYVKSNPPDPKTADEHELRADLEHLVGEFHWIYAFTALRERERSRLSSAVRNLTVILLIALAIIAFLGFYRTRSIPTLPIVAAMGMIGGFISLQRRIESVPATGDPIVSIFALSQSRSSVYLAPISGAVFALVIYLVFIATLAQGALFPKMVTLSAKPNAETTFSDFVRDTGPEDGVAFAKLLVWAFIAGFAERFVPDTLDRLVAKAETGKDTNA